MAIAATMSQQDDSKDDQHDHDMVMPGFRFHPTEEELVEFYLRRKVEGKRFNVEVIKFLDLYRYDPWELPALTAIGDLEWYFYVPIDCKYRNGDRPKRVTPSGYWKATGADRMIRTEDSRAIGLEKTLVFYSGKAPKGIRTSWIMNEYRLPHHETERLQKAEISLCRVYKRAGVEDMAQVNSSDRQLIEQDDAIDNRKNIGSAEQSDTAGTNSGKMSPKREPEITLEDLQKHFGRKLDDVAESFGVSRSTFKRICREKGISRWSRRKIDKVNDSLPMQDPHSQDEQATVAHTRLSAAGQDGCTDIERRLTSHPPLVDHSSDLIQECVIILEKIEGINWTVYSKALTELRGDHTSRKIFLAMSAHRRKEWALSL